MDKSDDVITFFSKYLCFKKVWTANFAGIIKIAIIFIKTTFKDSINTIRTYVLKCNLYPYFLI